MNDFELTIVGSNSSVPAFGRHQSCQFLKVFNQYLLIDCGEGSQNRLIEMKLKWMKISTILISHLHGDHFFGLPGLLSTMGLLGRTAPLRIIGPSGLKEFLLSVYRMTEGKINYRISITEIERDNPIRNFDFGRFQLESIPLKHGVPTYGYKIIENIKQLNIKPESIEKFSLDVEQIRAAKRGDMVYSKAGELIPQSELTFPRRSPRSYAYVSDTSYTQTIVNQLKGLRLLYHEATFIGDIDSFAELRGHSTARQAAKIAAEAEVGKLIVGHFSSRYESLDQHLIEAKEEFLNTSIAEEGKVFPVTH